MFHTVLSVSLGDFLTSDPNDVFSLLCFRDWQQFVGNGCRSSGLYVIELFQFMFL